jgi:large subunit ribosomal protein L9
MSVEIILFDNVKNLGRQGDLVKVADGYYRNYLGPQGLAAQATQANKNRFEKMKKKAQQLSAEKLADAQRLATELESVTVTIRAKAGEGERLFGSITSQDVVDALAAANYTVEKRRIEIPEPIKSLGEHEVVISLHSDVDAKLKIKVERA